MRQGIGTIATLRDLVAALSVSFIVGGCTELGPSGLSQDGITLINATPDTAGFLAVELESSHTLRIRERQPASELGNRVIAPSASIVVPLREIEGYYAGASVRFFLYQVSEGEAVYSGMLTLTHADLVALRSRVEISAATVPGLRYARLATQETPLLTIIDRTAVTGL